MPLYPLLAILLLTQCFHQGVGVHILLKNMMLKFVSVDDVVFH